MKNISAVLVALLAIGSHASDLQSPPPSHPQQTTPGVGRQGRSFPDFLAPFRGIFGRPRGGVGSAKQLYGVKPAASEINSKPNTASPFGGEAADGFRPSFPNFNDGSSSGFGPGGGDYGSSSHPPPKSNYGKPSLPLKHRPHSSHSSSSPPPHHHHSHHPHGHFGGPPGGPPGPDYQNQGPSGPYSPQHAAQQHQPQTYHTYSEPHSHPQHHHYFSGGNNGAPSSEGPQSQQYNEISGPPSYEYSPHHNAPNYGHSHGSSSPFHQSQQDPSQQQPDGPLPAQQFSRPALSRPGGGSGGKPPGQFGGGFEQSGNFGDFSGSTNFGGSIGDFGSSPQQGSQGKPPVGQGFFGGSDDYPEQYEEQTRNTREPEIITADNYLQTQGQGQGQYSQSFDDGFYPAAPSGLANSNPPTSHFGGFGSGADSGNGAFGGPGQSGSGVGSNSPILRSHPLKSGAASRPHFGSGSPYGSQEESRRHPFLYRPVSSSIRVPGAVDEDAIYGKPMMMSASSKKPVRAAIMKFKGAPGGQNRPTFKSSAPQHPQPEPFRKSENIIQLESPRDPTMVNAASYQNPSIMEPDTASSGHGHGHDFGHHGMETSNGDRILYHVSGHQGPYSYRYGFDTGKGYNRQFRFEEKDGKGYVTGKYGFYDKHGKLNVVKYSADPKLGFHAERDHGHQV